MENQNKASPQWAAFYKNKKALWYDPKIPIVVKAVIETVLLHRSDSKGWSLSIRKIAELLGTCQNTAIKAVNEAIKLGWLETNSTAQRKRRKLRLSASLRAPVEFSSGTNNNLLQWGKQSASPSKTDSGSVDEAINSNSNIKTANSNESQVENHEGTKSPPIRGNSREPWDIPSQGLAGLEGSHSWIKTF